VLVASDMLRVRSWTLFNPVFYGEQGVKHRGRNVQWDITGDFPWVLGSAQAALAFPLYKYSMTRRPMQFSSVTWPFILPYPERSAQSVFVILDM
jgi:hypothetical protein